MNKKTINEGERNKKSMKYVENEKQNDRHKSNTVNENIKCEQINPSNQNSEIVRMDKKQDPVTSNTL